MPFMIFKKPALLDILDHFTVTDVRFQENSFHSFLIHRVRITIWFYILELLCHSHLIWTCSIFFPSFLSLRSFWPFLSSTMLVFEWNDGERWQDNGWLTSGCWRWSMWRDSSELQVMSRMAPSTINHQRWTGNLWRNGEPSLALPAITGVMRLTRAECWFGSSCGSRHWVYRSAPDERRGEVRGPEAGLADSVPLIQSRSLTSRWWCEY